MAGPDKNDNTKTTMTEEELLQWYERFKEALKGNGIDLNDKSQMFRVRCVKPDENGTVEMHYAFPGKGTDSLCSHGSVLDADDEEYKEAFEKNNAEKKKYTNALLNLHSLPDGPEKDAKWVELTDKSNQVDLDLNNYLDSRVSETYEKAMRDQTVPENAEDKIGRIAELYDLAEHGQLFIMPAVEDDTMFRQIYNTDDGEVVVSETDHALVKKGCDIGDAQLQYVKRHNQTLLVPPVAVKEPERPVLKELGDEPERPSGLRRFLCEHFSFFDRLLGQKVHDYDRYMEDKAENQRLTEEYDRKAETYATYQEEQRAYKEQVNNAQLEIFHEIGLYTQNSNVPELREKAEMINSVLGDKKRQAQMMDDMNDPTKQFDAASLARLNRKNASLCKCQVKMARPGRYAADGTLTEEGIREREYERTHLPDLEESLTRLVGETNNKLGIKVNFIKRQDTREMYARYFYLRRVQNDFNAADAAHREEMRAKVAPWNMTAGVDAVLGDPAFSAVLETYENKNMTGEEVFAKFETLSKGKTVPRNMGREQLKTMSGMAPNSQARLVMKLGQVGFIAAVKSGTEEQPAPDRDQIIAMMSSTLLQDERTANGGQPGPLEKSVETVGGNAFIASLLEQPGVKEKVAEWEKNWPDSADAPDFLRPDPKAVESLGKTLENKALLKMQAAQETAGLSEPETKIMTPSLQ